MKNTKDSSNPEIINIYKVRRWEEVSRFEPHQSDKNKKLLWHGSPTR